MNIHNVPGDRYHPTMKQIIWGTIAFLQSHPRVREPKIFSPVVNESFAPEEIKVQAWKTYGGIELVEPGLTIAVYPMAQAFDTRKGVVSSSMQNKSCVFSPATLGGRTGLDYNDEATYRLIVQAYYQDPTTPGDTIRLPIDKLVGNEESPWTSHNYNVRLKDPKDPYYNYDPQWFAPGTYPEQRFVERDEVFFDISPGEEILREWMDLLRIALSDLPNLFPFAVRSTEVEAIDYPTSTLFRQPTDVFFHTAYIMWRLNLNPPATWRHFLTLPPVSLGIEENTQVPTIRQA